MPPVSELVVISTGGTIAMTPPRADAGVVPSLTGQDLVGNLPPLPDPSLKISVENLYNLPGPHLSFEQLWTLAERIRVLTEEDPGRAFVITMGTDILEEAVYFLDLTVGDLAPVVMTGAMRSSNQLGYEGYANVYQSLITASSPLADRTGAVLVMNEEIHAARDVQKSYTTNPATFISPGWGPLGLIVEGEAWIKRLKTARETIRPVSSFPRVELLKCTAAMDGFLLDCALDRGLDGLVVETLGVGHVSTGMADAMTRAVTAGIPVVVTSRCPIGTTLTKTYGFKGSESDLVARGTIMARGLTGPKSRIKLTLALGAGDGVEQVRARFDREKEL